MLSAEGFAALPEADRPTYRALNNALADLGEAVKLLSPELLARHTGVDRHGWTGLRDVVAHQDFGLELPRRHPTVTDELPALLAAVVAELVRADEEPEDGSRAKLSDCG